MAATPGQAPDRPQEVSYTDTKVIGNGSFGVVYQAKLCDTGELVAIKKVLQDKRFKVRIYLLLVYHLVTSLSLFSIILMSFLTILSFSLSINCFCFRIVSYRSWGSWITVTLSVCATSSTPAETKWVPLFFSVFFLSSIMCPIDQKHAVQQFPANAQGCGICIPVVQPEVSSSLISNFLMSSVCEGLQQSPAGSLALVV